ncbi:MAG: hypothetical protein U9M98_01565 [Patescibacteria group bacterium]|nr:hypothetical protein [Patescibacteria group bacterium]
MVLSGTASQYAPGVMEATIQTRQSGRTAYNLPKNLPPVDGFAALAEEYYIGKIVFFRSQGAGEWEAFLVVDYAGKSDWQSATDHRSGYQWIKTSSIVAEVDAATGRRWGKSWGGIPVQMIIPPKGSLIFPSRLGNRLPKHMLDSYSEAQLAGFTILLPEK